MAEPTRLPDFVIIGAMKSATSSLFWWLDEQPETFMAHPKETRFFSDLWSNGVDWYAAKFAGARPDQLLGEGSQNYTDPQFAADAAERMAKMIPDATLIYVVRHPVERLRSHYRHEMQRRREPRSLIEALGEPGNPYVAQSSYRSCLQPYIDGFPREQILVVRFEDLVRPPAPAWTQILRALSLRERPLPEGSRNVTAEKGQWTRAMAWAKGRGLLSSRRIARVPKPVRRVAKVVFARGGASYAHKLEGSMVPIPEELLGDMWEDVGRLETWLGRSLWNPEDSVPLREAG